MSRKLMTTAGKTKQSVRTDAAKAKQSFQKYTNDSIRRGKVPYAAAAPLYKK